MNRVGVRDKRLKWLGLGLMTGSGLEIKDPNG